MLIRTQSREALAEIVNAYVSEMMGEKDYYIFGTCAGHGMFSGAKITLGIYRSKEKALEELDRIEDFFSKKPNGIYKMSKINGTV